MGESRCVHDLLPRQCGLCRPAPSGLAERVTVTPGGTVFHGTARCEALVEGQRKALRLGLEVHDPRAVPLAQVLHDRPPCVHCFPDYAPEGTRLCWIRRDGVWYKGLLKRWSGRNAANLWEADVAYVADLALLDVVADQRSLLPREPGQEAPPLSTR
ncbi:hypothetical protein HNR06_003449 [Nocardiopsis arvandica]|uniref:Uncharacterized protein n=1 Tax=Nocardiopsis sinuspersici TaxID=501010 RepID=A0A7Y9XFU8_9ACTN|nr:hypothetical protein [Nocardiopsis sinuspersici]NYH53860.1 hypothetical protein [Nocardiopsis sinuspersici]